MVLTCCVPGCGNNAYTKSERGTAIRFHTFPKDPHQFQQWKFTLGLSTKTVSKWMTVCSEHFVYPDDYIVFQTSVKPRLKANIVPTKKLPSCELIRKKASQKRRGPKIGRSLSNKAAQMPSNVEIKASITDAQTIINKAAELSKSHGVCLEQQDTYFNVLQGRLKLRETLGDVAQLVFYERPDEEGPKLCNYSKQTFKNNDEAQGLKACLSAALGVKGVVKKKRQLFMVENTRVHVDNVDGLGDFMELEVMLQRNQSAEEGQKIAEDLMDQLGVPKEALICCSYIDLLLAQK